MDKFRIQLHIFSNFLYVFVDQKPLQNYFLLSTYDNRKVII